MLGVNAPGVDKTIVDTQKNTAFDYAVNRNDTARMELLTTEDRE